MWRTVSTINPLLADGHRFIGYPACRDETQRHRSAGARLFPFEVVVSDRGTVTVVSALGGDRSALAGRAITRINGVPTPTIVQALLSRVHGDTPRFRAGLLSTRWWFYYWKVYGAPAAYALQLDGATGTRLHEVPGSTAQPVMLLDEDRFDRQFRVIVRPDGVGVLTLRTFAWPDP